MLQHQWKTQPAVEFSNLLEKECSVNKQYCRQAYLEISKIAETIQLDELKNWVLKLSDCVTPVDPGSIEACHQLAKTKTRPKRVIIKLSKRKDVFNNLQLQKKLKSVGITNMGLPLFRSFHESKPMFLL